jgi:hypothetical protein
VAASAESGAQIVGQAADATQQRPGAHVADRSNGRRTRPDQGKMPRCW